MSRRLKTAAARPALLRPAHLPVVTEEPERFWTIGELAKEHNITTRTIRFYESRNLISPARKGTARTYSRRDRARLILILRGKNLGFSLEDIREFLDLRDADPAHVKQTRTLLASVEARIAELETKQSDIERSLTDLRAVRAQCLQHLETTGAGRPTDISADRATDK
jgi:DNA-binding transcriptional MerR regulator